jgi:hypothetical protein
MQYQQLIEIPEGSAVDMLLKEENVLEEMLKIVFIKSMTQKEHQNATVTLNL